MESNIKKDVLNENLCVSKLLRPQGLKEVGLNRFVEKNDQEDPFELNI